MGEKREEEILGRRCHCICLCLGQCLKELAVQAEKVVSKFLLSCNDRKHASLSNGEGQWFWYFYTGAQIREWRWTAGDSELRGLVISALISLLIWLAFLSAVYLVQYFL